MTATQLFIKRGLSLQPLRIRRMSATKIHLVDGPSTNRSHAVSVLSLKTHAFATRIWSARTPKMICPSAPTYTAAGRPYQTVDYYGNHTDENLIFERVMSTAMKPRSHHLDAGAASRQENLH